MATRALATSFPLGGSHIVAMATEAEAELSGCQAVLVWKRMVGAGGRWRGGLRFRTPTAGILGCHPVFPKEGERPPSWIGRVGFFY